MASEASARAFIRARIGRASPPTRRWVPFPRRRGNFLVSPCDSWTALSPRATPRQLLHARLRWSRLPAQPLEGLYTRDLWTASSPRASLSCSFTHARPASSSDPTHSHRLQSSRSLSACHGRIYIHCSGCGRTHKIYKKTVIIVKFSPYLHPRSKIIRTHKSSAPPWYLL